MNSEIFFDVGDSIKFRITGNDTEELRKRAAELAADAPGIIQSLAEVQAAAYAVSAFKKDPERKDPPPINKGTQPGKSDIPNCECGIPMTDVRGKVYQKGTKKGQNYPYSFYRSNDCTSNCEARN